MYQRRITITNCLQSLWNLRLYIKIRPILLHKRLVFYPVPYFIPLGYFKLVNITIRTPLIIHIACCSYVSLLHMVEIAFHNVDMPEEICNTKTKLYNYYYGKRSSYSASSLPYPLHNIVG